MRDGMTNFLRTRTAPQAVGDWLKAKPGTERHAAGVSPVRLCRHRQDHARHATSPTHVDGEVKFAAFTGKAASVMRGKGCHGASTIHS